jgi:hypothetical protein
MAPKGAQGEGGEPHGQGERSERDDPATDVVPGADPGPQRGRREGCGEECEEQRSLALPPTVLTGLPEDADTIGADPGA